MHSSEGAWASSSTSFSLWEAIPLGRESVDFCCFFCKHSLARLRMAKEGFFMDEFYNLLSSRHPLLGGIILRDNIRACTPVLRIYYVS